MLKFDNLFLMLFSTLTFLTFNSSKVHAQQESLDCSLLKTKKVVYKSQVYEKLQISDPKFLRCVKTPSSAVWKVTKSSWSEQDESNFELFLKRLGESKCKTVDDCLSSSANMYFDELDLLVTHYADCADFPYYLRAYFAFRNNLPMVVTSSIKQNPYSPEQLASIERDRQALLKSNPTKINDFESRLEDIRSSRNGNYPVRKLQVPSKNGAEVNFFQVARTLQDSVSSGTYRMLKPSVQLTSLYPDFYSPQILNQSIRPGTVIYSPAGHVAIVYEVLSSGEVLYMDSHPDNSVTRKAFNDDFKMSIAQHGGNFKNWRPFELTNIQYAGGSRVIKSAQVYEYADESLPDYSLEQYEGHDFGSNKKTVYRYSIPGQGLKEYDFYTFTKLRLSKGRYRIYPLQEMQNEMNRLCTDVQDRILAVDVAIQNSIHLARHPEKLPENIFGASGEWESYSSPGRDLRLKQKSLAIYEQVKNWQAQIQQRNNGLIVYSGRDFKADMLNIYLNSAKQCSVQYKLSNGQIRSLDLHTVMGQLARLSFDPYICAEKRWGEKDSYYLQQCKDDAEKNEWHVYQQFLRNRSLKNTNEVHGWSLDELKKLKVDQTDQSDQFNLYLLLNSL